MRDKVFAALDIDEVEVFEEFFVRNEGENERQIAAFMNQTEEDEDNALIFYKELKEEEIEVQIELSKFYFKELIFFGGGRIYLNNW